MPNIKKLKLIRNIMEVSYYSHNKFIIIICGNLLGAGAGALAPGGEAPVVCHCWSADLGDRPRAGGALERTRSRGTRARGEP